MNAVVDFPVKPEARPYVDAFADDAREPQWLRERRRQGLDRFARLGFPGRRSEEWRYLDLRRLEGDRMLPGALGGGGHLSPSDVIGDDGLLLVFKDGAFVPSLSRLLPLPAGVFLGSVSEALEAGGDKAERVRAALADTGEDAFAALNAAFFSDGFVLDVAPGTVVRGPIQIVHLADDMGQSFHTRSFVTLGAGSRATILESYLGIGGYWRNDVANWRIGEGAALTHVVLVEESMEATHLGHASATLAAHAKLEAFALLLDGRTVRHELAVTLAGANASCHIDGAFLVSRRREANIVTTIDHAAPGGTTSELIKGVAAGQGHGAFQGKIIVREGAQQTDARQTSRNLILGRQASIDTKPELEILADDVKCAHGASVGELDEAALFYLRARGIPTEEARRILVEGFLREPIEGIADPDIRQHLLRRLSERLGRLEPIA